MLTHFKSKIARAVEYHPYLWYGAWLLVHKLPFLLPHDQSYLAIRHFGCTREHLLVDIGANDGISALSFHKLAPEVRIFSLEPNSVHAPSLEVLKGRLSNFDYRQLAAGDTSGQLRLFSPSYKGIELHTFASSSLEQVQSAVRKSFGGTIAAKLKITESTVPVVKIDDLELAPHIIKIDCEGYDYRVLLGASETIHHHRPFIIIEACHTEIRSVRQYFDELGYALLDFHHQRDLFSPHQDSSSMIPDDVRNIFAVPNEKISALPMTQFAPSLP